MVEGPLDGLRVLDLSSGIPGAYAARMLSDAGAEIVRAEIGDGDPLRGSALYEFLHHSQSVVEVPTLAEARELIDAADAVIVGPGVEGAREVVPTVGQVVVAITPYGLHGPGAAKPASDLVLQAESGGLATRGLPHEPPFQAGGLTNEWIAGAYAAAAALAAWRSVRAGGTDGELVDVSMLEAAHIAGAAYSPLSHLMAGSPPIAAPARVVETVEIHPTLDGWVGFTTNSAQQFQDFLVLIERADLLADDDLASAAGRQARYDDWVAIVNGWTSQRSTAEIVELAGDLRIPCAPVQNAADVLVFEHFLDRGVFHELGDRGLRHPRRPWLLDGVTPGPGVPPKIVGAATVFPERDKGAADSSERPRPLAGIRVVDLTAWWAGPTATHLLACLGADVIHVESVSRPDGMRMNVGALRGSETWWERSAFFLSSNTNKRGLTLDLTTEPGMAALERLVRTADVLVENFTPRVLDNLGLAHERLEAWNPGLITVRMPAFGLDGPWRDRPGFAQTMEQLSGLAWLTGFADGQPHNQRGPCDPNGGVHAAFGAMCALEARARDGRGRVVEAPFIEVALNVAAEAITEYSAHGVVRMRDGNRSPHCAPQGIYACAGDEQWLALAVETDEQWVALVEYLGVPRWTADPQYATLAGRRVAHDAIDEHLTRWAATQDRDDAAARLLAAGVPAGRVLDPRLSAAQAQYDTRGFYETLVHPVVGEQPFVTLPFRMSSIPRWLDAPAPTLGQHNHEILAALGYSDEEITALAADRVIGTVPLGL